jgi:DinB superfamily
MNFTIDKSIEILQRTPETLAVLLENISTNWTSHNEGGETWSVYDVIGHLIHGDKKDWMIRTELILSDKDDKRFNAFDRFAQFEASQGKSLQRLLIEFKEIRIENIEKLRRLNISTADLLKSGIHPVFGEVSLLQLLSAWVVHDLDHISQIARVMAKQYKEDVGPWIEFLKILRQ